MARRDGDAQHLVLAGVEVETSPIMNIIRMPLVSVAP